MKRFSLKLTLTIITFFIGVSVVSFWYFLRIESTDKKSLLDAISFVPNVKPIYENPCNYPQPLLGKLEPEEAVYLVECFVLQNGYTDLPPITDKSKLTPENLFPQTDEEGLKMRRGTLENKAYSYYPSELYGGSWVIMFRYQPRPKLVEYYGDSITHIGRAVVMDFYGKDLRIQHSDYPLRMPEAKIINP